MTYIRVRWIHTFPDEPVLLFSEIDGQRWEARKVDFFSDGRLGYADRFHNSQETLFPGVPLLMENGPNDRP